MILRVVLVVEKAMAFEDMYKHPSQREIDIRENLEFKFNLQVDLVRPFHRVDLEIQEVP